MEAQTLSTHVECATLENLPPRVCEGGPVFQLGKVVLDPWTWEAIPSGLLLRALELHSCGIFGDLEDYEITNNFYNLGNLEDRIQGSRTYIGCIFSRWRPNLYPPFNVMSFWHTELETAVITAKQ